MTVILVFYAWVRHLIGGVVKVVSGSPPCTALPASLVLLEILKNTTFVAQICYLPQNIKHS